METSATDNIARIRRSYDRLLEARRLLEKAGQADIAASLFLPLGQLEQRFDLATPAEVEAASASKNASIADN